MSSAIVSLGALCHLLSFHLEGSCHPLSFPLGGLVSPAVISLGRPCHLLSSWGEPRVACCHVVPCDCWLSCNLVHTCARGTRWGVGLSCHSYLL